MALMNHPESRSKCLIFIHYTGQLFDAGFPWGGVVTLDETFPLGQGQCMRNIYL